MDCYIENSVDVELMCGDGFAGRSYYILINKVRVDVCLNNGNLELARKQTKIILDKLNILYEGELNFKHDGWM